MFNADFYPTPPDTIDRILEGETIQGKIIYEPSGGKGDLVDALIMRGAKQVISTELDADLRKILQTKCRVIGEDFLLIKAEEISHIDLIVMNPPFSRAAEHINHAYQIAPAGCRVIALCNAETIRNAYSKSREELAGLIETSGDSQEIGHAFNTAQRKTDVEVSLIRLKKPGANYNQEFEGFFLEDEHEPDGQGIMSYNLVRDLVNRYVESIKIFDQQLETAVRLNGMMHDYLTVERELAIQITRNSVPVQRNEFKKAMQKSGWRWIFSKLNMQKHTTKGLREDINKFVESQDQVPFTMRNIYKMLEIVIGTTGQRMDKAILEVFDRVTDRCHENRMNLEGWKTNSHFLLNRRFIMPGICWQDQRWDKGSEISISSSNELVDDLVKAICYLTGKNFDDCISLYKRIKCDLLTMRPIYGEWFDWDFFRCRAYKKGTMHFEFKEEKVWAAFNQRVAKLKGYPLPESKTQTKYQKRQTKAWDKKPDKSAAKPTILTTIHF